MPAEPIFCSANSLSLGEPLFATAPRIESWILLEYSHPFSAKAFEDSHLPVEIKAHLSAARDRIPHSRLLMIKKKNDPAQIGFNLILVNSSPHDRRMRRYHLGDTSNLLSIDIEAVLSRPEALSASAGSDPLFLVCTNGKKDRCCARFGLPVFAELEKFAPGDVWQTSHVGGHRFAANVISLPDGIYYGRLPVSEAGHIVSQTRNGQIHLQYYRGRTCYSAEQQAADYYLRWHTGYTALDDLFLVDTTQQGENQWLVRFETKAAESFRLAIRRGLSDYSVIESCDSPQKAKPQSLYYLEGISS